MANYLDITIRVLLIVFSIASFVPQVNRIKDSGYCTGISVYYALYNLIIATYEFTLMLFAAINWEGSFMTQEPPDVRDWLNIAQFTVSCLGQLLLLYLIIALPPSRPAQSRFAIIAYLSFLAVSLLPVIGETLIDFESDTDREWYCAPLIGLLLYIFGPMVQILGIAAFRAQAQEIRSRDSHAANALSIRGLVAQAVVFFMVGISFVFRIQLPSEELDEHFIVNLRTWYWTVGWATINNIIFAVAQGLLAWIAWRHRDGEHNERSPLLA